MTTEDAVAAERFEATVRRLCQDIPAGKAPVSEVVAAAREMADAVRFEASPTREQAQQRAAMFAPMAAARDLLRARLVSLDEEAARG